MSRWIIFSISILTTVLSHAGNELKRAEATMNGTIASLQRTQRDANKISVLKEMYQLVVSDYIAIEKKVQSLPIGKERDELLPDKAEIAKIRVVLGALSRLTLKDNKLTSASCGDAYDIIFTSTHFPGAIEGSATAEQKSLYRALTASCTK
jgi:hypothetical protein